MHSRCLVSRLFASLALVLAANAFQDHAYNWETIIEDVDTFLMDPFKPTFIGLPLNHTNSLDKSGQKNLKNTSQFGHHGKPANYKLTDNDADDGAIIRPFDSSNTSDTWKQRNYGFPYNYEQDWNPLDNKKEKKNHPLTNGTTKGIKGEPVTKGTNHKPIKSPRNGKKVLPPKKKPTVDNIASYQFGKLYSEIMHSSSNSKSNGNNYYSTKVIKKQPKLGIKSKQGNRTKLDADLIDSVRVGKEMSKKKNKGKSFKTIIADDVKNKKTAPSYSAFFMDKQTQPKRNITPYIDSYEAGKDWLKRYCKRGSCPKPRKGHKIPIRIKVPIEKLGSCTLCNNVGHSFNHQHHLSAKLPLIPANIILLTTASPYSIESRLKTKRQKQLFRKINPNVLEQLERVIRIKRKQELASNAGFAKLGESQLLGVEYNWPWPWTPKPTKPPGHIGDDKEDNKPGKDKHNKNGKTQGKDKVKKGKKPGSSKSLDQMTLNGFKHGNMNNDSDTDDGIICPVRPAGGIVHTWDGIVHIWKDIIGSHIPDMGKELAVDGACPKGSFSHNHRSKNPSNKAFPTSSLSEAGLPDRLIDTVCNWGGLDKDELTNGEILFLRLALAMALGSISTLLILGIGKFIIWVFFPDPAAQGYSMLARGDMEETDCQVCRTGCRNCSNCGEESCETVSLTCRCTNAIRKSASMTKN